MGLWHLGQLQIVRNWHGQRWGFQGYPHLYPSTHAQGYGFCNPCTGTPPNQLRNLATAVQVSIDTAVQCCEVKYSGGHYVGGRYSRWCSCFILVIVLCV